MNAPNHSGSADARDRKTMIGPVLGGRQRAIPSVPEEVEKAIVIPPLLVRGGTEGPVEATAPDLDEFAVAALADQPTTDPSGRVPQETPQSEAPGARDLFGASAEDLNIHEPSVWPPAGEGADSGEAAVAESPDSETMETPVSDTSWTEPESPESEPFRAATADADVGEPVAFGTDTDPEDGAERDDRIAFTSEPGPLQEVSGEDTDPWDGSFASEDAEHLIERALGTEDAPDGAAVLDGEALPPWGTTPMAEAVETDPGIIPEERAADTGPAPFVADAETGAELTAGEPVAGDHQEAPADQDGGPGFGTDLGEREEGAWSDEPETPTHLESGTEEAGQTSPGLIADDELIAHLSRGAFEEPVTSAEEPLADSASEWLDDRPQSTIGEPAPEDEVTLSDLAPAAGDWPGGDPVAAVLDSGSAVRLADRLEDIARQLRREGPASLLRGQPDSLRALIAGYALGVREARDDTRHSA